MTYFTQIMIYYLCNKIIVLRRGEIVDDFNVDDLFLAKRNSYTKEIIKNSFVLGTKDKNTRYDFGYRNYKKHP